MRAAFNGDPIPLDRAGLLIAAVDLLLEEVGRPDVNVRDYVRIAPAIFHLGGFTEAFFRENFKGIENRPKFNRLKQLTSNFKHEFFDVHHHFPSLFLKK